MYTLLIAARPAVAAAERGSSGNGSGGIHFIHLCESWLIEKL